MALPLEGLKVVECSHGSAGPRGSGILGDYGAAAIWIYRRRVPRRDRRARRTLPEV